MVKINENYKSTVHCTTKVVFKLFFKIIIIYFFWGPTIQKGENMKFNIMIKTMLFLSQDNMTSDQLSFSKSLIKWQG